MVAVTAFSDRYSRQRAMEAGCVEFVTKPIDFDEFDGILRRHLHVH